MTLALPLVAWGTVEDISGAGWASVGSPTVTPGQIDPFGGTGAVLIDDEESGTLDARSRTFSGLTIAGTQWATTFIKAGSSASSGVRWYDSTASVFLASFKITWTAGVPVTTLTDGSGSCLPPVSVGNGWYLLVWSADGAIVGHTQRIYLYPTYPGSALLGTSLFYWQSAVLLDYPDNPMGWAQPRDGSGRTRSAAGVYDSWVLGTDHHFTCDVQWVPAIPRSVPQIVSGWSGYGEIPCVNQGISQMLTAGRAANALRWVPDRSACTTYIDSELIDPWQTAPTSHPNSDRKVGLHLRNTATSFPLYTG